MVQLCLPEAVQLLPYKLPDSRRGGVQAEPPDAAQCPEAAEAADTATRNQRTGRADPLVSSTVTGRGVLQPPAEPSTDSPYRLQIADSPRLAGNRRSTVHTTPA
ncbi:hypothetical protein E4U44_002396 [Claviceps purpurea]|nr:hypothetical protein E4U44_002396 [Claviceps purpurea]